MADIKILEEILALRRPHGGLGETYVAEKILSRLTPELHVFKDTAGYGVDEVIVNMVYVMTTDPESKSLFCAHLDSVHREDGFNPVIYDTEMEWMSKADGLALGADDGAGIWILYHMIEAGVPGTYIFTVGEECGGVGAKWLADNAGVFLAKFDRAVTFDRKGTTSIITHMRMGERVCSAVFGDALAKELNVLTGAMFGEFVKDDGGVYTDTAEFSDVIPECTNISAGYMNEHTGRETLDVGYLKYLLEACLVLNWEALPVARDPTVVDNLWESSGYGGRYTRDFGKPGDRDRHYPRGLTLLDLQVATEEEIYELVFESPDEVAELLIELAHGGGYAANDMEVDEHAQLGWPADLQDWDFNEGGMVPRKW